MKRAPRAVGASTSVSSSETWLIIILGGFGVGGKAAEAAEAAEAEAAEAEGGGGGGIAAPGKTAVAISLREPTTFLASTPQATRGPRARSAPTTMP